MNGKPQASWDETWMGVAEAMAHRSRCSRQHIGAVIVDPRQRVVATGYNGSPANFRTPYSHLECKNWCSRAKDDGIPHVEGYVNCYSVHAEANALLFCDRRDREGGCIYTTGVICWDCAKLVANSGLKRVVMLDDGSTHRDVERSEKLLKDCDLEVVWRT